MRTCIHISTEALARTHPVIHTQSYVQTPLYWCNHTLSVKLSYAWLCYSTEPCSPVFFRPICHSAVPLLPLPLSLPPKPHFLLVIYIFNLLLTYTLSFLFSLPSRQTQSLRLKRREKKDGMKGPTESHALSNT